MNRLKKLKTKRKKQKMQIELIENNLDIKLTKTQKEQFLNFESLFKIYNSHTNLVSKNDEKNLFEKHIYDSLCLNIFFKKYKIEGAQKILDIGTGGGFPAIPLAIAFKEFQIYPVDSIAKKIGFIELIEKELRLENIHPLCKRAEEMDNEFKESFNIITSRAVAPLNILLEYAIPFLKAGGYFIAYKSKGAKEEIDGAKNALSTLNAEIIEEIEYKLPGHEEFMRELVVIKKTKKTPKEYPRKSGLAKKSPL